MNSNPVLSVIIPVYNVEPYLADALRSVTEQSFRDMEILCVNDGSEDGSADILESFRLQDPRIRVISQENAGLSQARNRGLEAASGEFIYYFDSDDLLADGAFAYLIPRMQEENLDLLLFDVEPFAEEGISGGILDSYRKYYTRAKDYPGILPGAEMMVRQFRNEDYLVGAWSYISRRSFVTENRLRFEKGLFYEDNLYTFEAMLRAKRTGYTAQTFFRRRLRAGSITQSKKTFLHAYSYFLTHVKMLAFCQEMLSAQTDGGRDEDWIRSSEIMTIIGRTLANARNDYRNCSGPERKKAAELAGKEKVLFSLYVEEYCRLQEQQASQKARADGLQKEADRIRKELDSIRASRAFRFGESAAAPVRMARRLVSSREPGSPEQSTVRNPSVQTKEAGTERKPSAVWLFGSPSHGNLGDHMIAEASLEFLGHLYPGAKIREIPRDAVPGKEDQLKKEVKKGDPIYYIGGGNLGNYWPKNEEVRQTVIRLFPENPVIILPQSIRFTDDADGLAALEKAQKIYRGSNILLACRGEESLAFAREKFTVPTVLAPDLVMGSSVPVWWKTEAGRRGILICLRQDRESRLGKEGSLAAEKAVREIFPDRPVSLTDMVKPYEINPDQRRKELSQMYRMISGAEAVVTDRLHCMIFCAQTETPCIVFSNDHHKIRECLRWLSDLPYIVFADEISDLPAAFSTALGSGKREYPLRKIREQFAALAEEIKKTEKKA